MALAQLSVRAVLAAAALLLLQSAYTLIVRASHAHDESQALGAAGERKYEYNTR
jgi:hypothetical protein